MDQWHFAYKGKCAVCLAGAVMAQTLGVPITITASPFALESEHYAKLRALDEFRSGYIHIGLSRLGMESIKYSSCPVIPYDTDKNQFHTDMENMAAILEKEGL